MHGYSGERERSRHPWPTKYSCTAETKLVIVQGGKQALCTRAYCGRLYVTSGFKCQITFGIAERRGKEGKGSRTELCHSIWYTPRYVSWRLGPSDRQQKSAVSRRKRRTFCPPRQHHHYSPRATNPQIAYCSASSSHQMTSNSKQQCSGSNFFGVSEHGGWCFHQAAFSGNIQRSMCA